MEGDGRIMNRVAARLFRALIFACLAFTVFVNVVLAEEDHLGGLSEARSSERILQAQSSERILQLTVQQVQRGGILRRARSRRNVFGVGVPPPLAPTPSPDCSACEATQCLITPCTNTYSRVCGSCSSLQSCGESKYRRGCACVACGSCPAG